MPGICLAVTNLARDVFSRVVHGARSVMIIAPFATLFAFMVGVTLGLPAGYFGGRMDTVLSFLANLVLAFPVILLFYLLVNREIVETGIPMLSGSGSVPAADHVCRGVHLFAVRNAAGGDGSGAVGGCHHRVLGPIRALPSTPIRSVSGG